jgi:hypothetical protein
MRYEILVLLAYFLCAANGVGAADLSKYKYAVSAQAMRECAGDLGGKECIRRKSVFIGMVENGVNNNGRIVCGKGYELSGIRCNRCGNYSADYQFRENTCERGIYTGAVANGSNLNGKITCDNGYEPNGIQCSGCHDYTAGDLGSVYKKNACEIEKCKNGYSFNEMQRRCMIICPEGSRVSSECPTTAAEKTRAIQDGNVVVKGIAEMCIIMDPGNFQQCYCTGAVGVEIADDATKSCVQR